MNLDRLSEQSESLIRSFQGDRPTVSNQEVHGVFTVWKRGLTCVCMAMLGLTVGCSNPDIAKINKPTKSVTWPELAALRSPDVNMGILLNAQTNNIAGVKKAATDPSFQELVDEFNSSSIPKEFDSPERQKAKEKVSKDYNSLIGLCKSMGSDKDIKAQALSISESVSKLTDPDLK